MKIALNWFELLDLFYECLFVCSVHHHLKLQETHYRISTILLFLLCATLMERKTLTNGLQNSLYSLPSALYRFLTSFSFVSFPFCYRFDDKTRNDSYISDLLYLGNRLSKMFFLHKNHLAITNWNDENFQIGLYIAFISLLLLCLFVSLRFH